MPSGTVVLNLGCESKTSARPEVINIDWSIALRIRRNPLFRALASLVMRGERLNRFRSLPVNIRVHNLARGIPFASGSVDVAYHSHVLEHLDRDVADQLGREVHRVLKPGGLHRIVVPDFEALCRDYLAHIQICMQDGTQIAGHDKYIAAILEQSVRKEAFGTSQQTRARRLMENILLGDARRRGETHQWMYDRFTISAYLERNGFKAIQLHGFKTSSHPNWHEYCLDQDEAGNEYKRGSLYVEARK
jgi:predicted SAM-dependent methyltransferase